MADELKDQRVVTMMSPSELEAIDEWMFKNRLKSRGEAIRRLCHVGMNAESDLLDLLQALIKGLEAENEMIKRIRSGDVEGLIPFDILKIGQSFHREVYAIVGARLMESMAFRSAPSTEEGLAVAKEIAARLKKLGSTQKQLDVFVDFMTSLKKSDEKNEPNE